MSLSANSRTFFSSEYIHYKTFIHENCLENYNDKFQEKLSRPGITDPRARRLRNNGLHYLIRATNDVAKQTLTQRNITLWRVPIQFISDIVRLSKTALL